MKRKTVTMPVIHKTKNGKKYFVVYGQRVYLEVGMSKKDIAGIYKLLKKKLKPKTKISNSATAVVINNASKRRRNNTKKPFVSTLNDSNRVVVSQGKDSGDKDLINNLVNKLNKAMDTPKKPDQPLAIDYSEDTRL